MLLPYLNIILTGGVQTPPPLLLLLPLNLLIQTGDNVAVTVLGRGEGGGGALTRSQRGQVAEGFSALPWGFLKPIDCVRVPSFL